MAVVGAVRWKPDTYRSSLETTVAGLSVDPEGDGPPEGTIVMVAQLVAYDDQRFPNPQAYQSGNPATEQWVTVLYAEPIMMDLSAFASMTDQQAQDAWADALAAFGARLLPAVPVLIRAVRAAKIAPPVTIT